MPRLPLPPPRARRARRVAGRNDRRARRRAGRRARRATSPPRRENPPRPARCRTRRRGEGCAGPACRWSLLRVVSDLTHPSSGRVEVRGRPAADARRANEFGFVFQEPALLPWRSALDNVMLPLEVVKYALAERRPRSEALLEMVGLTKFVN